MKIKTKELSDDEVISKKRELTFKPCKPSSVLAWIIRLLSKQDLKATDFSYTMTGMEKLGKNEPCLILMNHSSFIDLKIAATVFADRRFNIVCTSDGFVGKKWLMKKIGCIPTNKFVTDIALVKNMMYAIKELNCSILMYPEASYSFDGTATPLPDSIGKCVKMLKVPVIMVRTYGAFHRDPLYNNLQLRDVKVSAQVEYLLSNEDIANSSSNEISELINERFGFDNFKWQQENNIKVDEDFRADYLNRVLYKCPECKTEGKMLGKGIHITCNECGKKYELTEYGKLAAIEGDTKFCHIPDWYKWERQCVRNEINDGKYLLDVEVDIYMMVDLKCIYKVGSGRLIHDERGFHLTGCEGKLDYRQDVRSSYSLYADYYWYEMGDVICIGNSDVLYYCFPKNAGDVVAKTRIATEELFKLKKCN